jgi:hypothetical protein
MFSSHEPSSPAVAKAVAVAAAAVLLVGVVLRLLGMFSLELWSDEARWCEHLLIGTGTWFRPVGYMWLTKQILALEINEPLLRSLSTVAGIAQLPLVYVALRHLVKRPVVAVVGTWLLAIHPVAVAMSKEFKPYAVEAMLHSALVVFALLYLRSKSARWLAALLITALVAPFLAWTVVFAYPGVFLVVGVGALRDKRLAHLGATAVACVGTLGILIAMFFARLAAKKPATQYWGDKYDVFYVDDQGVWGQVRWFFEKTAELAAFPAQLQMPWASWFVQVVQGTCVALCALGAVALVVRKDVRAIALLLMPWLPMLAFNAAGAWPYGMFRTNTFMLFYTGVLVTLGVDFLVELARRLPRAPRMAALALAVAGLVVTFPFDLGAFKHKGKGTLTSESSVFAALQRVYEVETGQRFDAPLDADTHAAWAARADEVNAGVRALPLASVFDDEAAGFTQPLLVMDGHACTSMRYYRDFHSDSAERLGDWLPSHFRVLCGSYGWRGWKQTLHDLRGRAFWIISAKTNWPEYTRSKLAKFCKVTVDEVIPPSTHIYRCEPLPDVLPSVRLPPAAPSPAPEGDAPAPAGDDGDGTDGTD